MLNRRSFLYAGSAFIPGLGLARGLAANESVAPRSLVTILLAGGLSHIDTFDPKPDAPSEIRGEYGAIPTRTPGVSFTELLPKLAETSSLFTLLRGVSHGVVIHDPAQRLVLTGSANPRPSTPSIGAIISQQVGNQKTEVPAYAAIPSIGPSAGELGQLHEAFNLLGDGGELLAMAPQSDDEAKWSGFQRRVALLEKLESISLHGSKNSAAISHAQAYQRATDSIASRELRKVTQVSNESPATLELYGESEFGKHLLYARRLVELGTRCVTVNFGGWDTHYKAFPTFRELLPVLDSGLAAFFTDLSQRKLLESTMVAVVTDFGRTPQLTDDGGRGHWPQAGCAILAGGRFRPGFCYGTTDRIGEEVTEGNCSPQDIGCTLLEELGIPTRTTRVPPTGRVLLPEGRLVTEILNT